MSRQKNWALGQRVRPRSNNGQNTTKQKNGVIFWQKKFLNIFYIINLICMQKMGFQPPMVFPQSACLINNEILKKSEKMAITR